ncbi:hypothetical protein GJR96_17140 [Haloferax sp. MBLA0076]|uniref:Uncharacterized protein n=1 Tax=Haloferax litoreum TaxID=2666140 RepID=A0A6A8GM59_9EURY|nr:MULTISPECIES: hypothetical protein [Haloferax]KAB1189903.1 hypothetical protein Hfx1148_17075 [Haloferax sp. CBA1148]MRX23672.1 hypothetical protein [Haloferax litoreum]
MRPRARRSGGLVVLVVFVVLSTSAVSSVSVVDVTPGNLFDSGPAVPDGVEEARDVSLVSVGIEEDRLWPFTSRAKSFDTLTLPINLVVKGDPARVRSLLVYSQDARWDETTESWKEAAGEQASPETGESVWGPATGADRYTYVDTEGPGGRWVDESMQLHDGTYFGSRVHLRLYGVGSRNTSWTAIQAHRDYWDWFRLRHTVTSLAGPQHTVERDLMDQPAVVDVRRERYGNGGVFDADGWVTVTELAPPQLASDTSVEDTAVESEVDADAERDEALDAGVFSLGTESTHRLTSIALLAFVVASVGGLLATTIDADDIDTATDRLERSPIADDRFQRSVALFLALIALPLVVRAAALALEGIAPNQPKVIAGLLYPVFVFAPPYLALRIPKDAATERWFSLAFLGYGIGLVADFALVGVSVVPIDLVLHRFVLLVSLGLLAVVGARRAATDESTRVALPAAVGLWVALLLWPLLLGV